MGRLVRFGTAIGASAVLMAGVAVAGSVRAAPEAVAAATVSAASSAQLRCWDPTETITFAAEAQVTFDDVPAGVTPGASFEVTGAVSFTAATPLRLDVPAIAITTGVSGWWVGPIQTGGAPTPFRQTVTAGISKPIELAISRYPLDQATVTDEAGTVHIATCEVVGGNTPVLVPLELPEDGSLQWFDLSADGVCNVTNGEVIPRTFNLKGVAPARLAPGQTGTIVADYSGLSSIYFDDVGLVFTGTAYGSPGYMYRLSNGQRAVSIETPPAGASGTLGVRFDRVMGTLSRPQPVGAQQFSCTLEQPLSVFEIPIEGTPVSTTTATTGPTSSSTSSTTATTMPTTVDPTTTTRSATPPTVPTTKPTTTTTAVDWAALLRWLLALLLGRD